MLPTSCRSCFSRLQSWLHNRGEIGPKTNFRLLRRNLFFNHHDPDEPMIEEYFLAREVFEDDHIMVSALVRETIHGRVLMKSYFGSARIVHQDGLYENDVYYALCYLNQGYDVKNNILWSSGLPIHGLNFNKVGSKKGLIKGLEMYRVRTAGRRGEKGVSIWTVGFHSN